MSSNLLTGKEKFIFKSVPTELNMLELWQWKYSDIYDIQNVIAEYIIEKALGIERSQNVGSWTLFDIEYRSKRIEVKETAYYHSWQEPGDKISMQRAFGVTKAYSKYKDATSSFERQNDIYVFCLNVGFTREESNPLDLDNWEFYIVPTNIINKECGNNKTISLGKVKSLSKTFKYDEIKSEIDRIINEMEKSNR